jgi:hypothetical protein
LQQNYERLEAAAAGSSLQQRYDHFENTGLTMHTHQRALNVYQLGKISIGNGNTLCIFSYINSLYL